MNTPFDFETEGENRIVYVRPVTVADLPDEISRELRNDAPELSIIYAVHDSDGERLALVRERKLAFILARQNDMAPVSVH